MKNVYKERLNGSLRNLRMYRVSQKGEHLLANELGLYDEVNITVLSCTVIFEVFSY